MRIELYDEKKKKNVAKLLEFGIVGHVPFQPYESHIKIFMQFYYECNLHGFANLVTEEYSTRSQNNSLSDNFYQKASIKKLYKHSLFGGKIYF